MKVPPKLYSLLLVIGATPATAQPAASPEIVTPTPDFAYSYALAGLVLLLVAGYVVRRSSQGRRTFRR